eukprot:scaffold82841_cov63-Cyclotella_meneghiniana.AAC.2
MLYHCFHGFTDCLLFNACRRRLSDRYCYRIVSTARFVTKTDRRNVLPRRCECDGYCPLMDMGRLAYRIPCAFDRRWPWLKRLVDRPSGGGAITAAAQHQKDQRMVSKSPRMGGSIYVKINLVGYLSD